jgi:hypothetical protein
MNKCVIFLLLVVFSCHSLPKNSFENDLNHESTIYNFVIQGFGHNFNDKKIYGSDILSYFGEIINITILADKARPGREYLEIEFDNIYIPIHYQEYVEIFKNQNITNEIFSDFLISEIMAKENIYYLYDVRIGMTIDDFINIFGKIDDSGKVDDNNRYIYNNKRIYLGWGVSIEGEITENTIFMLATRDKLTVEERDKFVIININENKIETIRWVL